MMVRPTFNSILFGTITYFVMFFFIRLFTDGFPNNSTGWLKLIIPSLFTALAMSMILGYTMDKFVGKGHPNTAVKVDDKLQPDEKIIYSTAANYFIRDLGGVGGKLFVTDKNLVFRSHKYNYKEEMKIIPLSDIKQIKPSKTLGIFNSGLTVILNDNNKEKFVVADRKLLLPHLPA